MPTYENNTAILVVVCVFTGFCFLRALPDKSTTTVSKHLLDIFHFFGVPAEIHSDLGTEFTGSVFTDMLANLGIQQREVAPYNPRAKGKVERLILTARSMVAKLLKGAVDWPRVLPQVQLAINTALSAITKTSPFSLMFARSPNLPISPAEIDNRAWDTRLEEYKNALVTISQKGQKDRQQQLDNRFTQPQVKKLEANSWVMLKDVNRTDKLDSRFVGPYRIVSQLNNGLYFLADSTGEYLGRLAPRHHLKAIPSLDDEISYEIEKILDHQPEDEGYQLLVRWKNYPEATWIHSSKLDDESILRSYFKSLKKNKIPVLKPARVYNTAKKNIIPQQSKPDKKRRSIKNAPYTRATTRLKSTLPRRVRSTT